MSLSLACALLGKSLLLYRNAHIHLHVYAVFGCHKYVHVHCTLCLDSEHISLCILMCALSHLDDVCAVVVCGLPLHASAMDASDLMVPVQKYVVNTCGCNVPVAKSTVHLVLNPR